MISIKPDRSRKRQSIYQTISNNSEMAYRTQRLAICLISIEMASNSSLKQNRWPPFPVRLLPFVARPSLLMCFASVPQHRCVPTAAYNCDLASDSLDNGERRADGGVLRIAEGYQWDNQRTGERHQLIYVSGCTFTTRDIVCSPGW